MTSAPRTANEDPANEDPANQDLALWTRAGLATPLGRFRAVALLEGVSYLLLFGVTMPLKYLADMPLPNKVVGMAHGVLSVVYVGLLIEVALKSRWSVLRSLVALFASLLPFGAFVLEARLRREARAGA